MSEPIIRDLPDGSKHYKDVGDGQYGDPFDYSCIIEPVSETECDITGAHGDMSADGNIRLGLALIGLGFQKITFQVPRGAKVTRWATYDRTDGTFDYHTVDLVSAAATYGAGKAL